jgi:Mg2+-importing ATPase
MFSVAGASLLLPFLPMLPKQILLTNFLTDFPYLSVASDNVDEEQLQQPGKWNMKLIRNYMIYFGIHSSLFDLLTFLTLLYLLKAPESTFQTGWFIESVVTELFILFIIRTKKSFIKSKPGKYLFILNLLGLVLTISLPYLPFAGDLGLVPLSAAVILSMFAIVLLYILTADLLKIWFFKRMGQET